MKPNYYLTFGLLRYSFLFLIILYSNSLYAVKCESSFLLQKVSQGNLAVIESGDKYTQDLLKKYLNQATQITKPYTRLLPLLNERFYKKLVEEALRRMGMGIGIEDPEFLEVTDSQIAYSMVEVFKDEFYAIASVPNWHQMNLISRGVSRVFEKLIVGKPQRKLQKKSFVKRTLKKAKRSVAKKMGLSIPRLWNYSRVSKVANSVLISSESHNLLRDIFRINLNFHLDSMNRSRNDLRSQILDQEQREERSFGAGLNLSAEDPNYETPQAVVVRARTEDLPSEVSPSRAFYPRNGIAEFLKSIKLATAIGLIDKDLINEITDLRSSGLDSINPPSDIQSQLFTIAQKTLSLLSISYLLMERRKMVIYLFDQINSPELKRVLVENLKEVEGSLSENWRSDFERATEEFDRINRELGETELDSGSRSIMQLEGLSEIRDRLDNLSQFTMSDWLILDY